MTEFEKAREWRKRLGLSVPRLAELSGFSREAIYWNERGKTPPSRTSKKPGKIKPWIWFRYKRVCAAVDAELRGEKNFDW